MVLGVAYAHIPHKPYPKHCPSWDAQGPTYLKRRHSEQRLHCVSYVWIQSHSPAVSFSPRPLILVTLTPLVVALEVSLAELRGVAAHRAPWWCGKESKSANDGSRHGECSSDISGKASLL